MNIIRIRKIVEKIVVAAIVIGFVACDKNDEKGKETDEPKNPTLVGVEINGVKWATFNVDKPGTFTKKAEDSGMFYQWNRKIGWEANNPLQNSEGGNTWDATASEGDTWEKINDPSPEGYRVPTEAEIRSLLNEEFVSNEWITQNGIVGRLFTDKTSGNSIFLPAALSRSNANGALPFPGSTYGNYWSNTIGIASKSAYRLDFGPGIARINYDNRANGFTVRPVVE